MILPPSQNDLLVVEGRRLAGNFPTTVANIVVKSMIIKAIPFLLRIIFSCAVFNYRI